MFKKMAAKGQEKYEKQLANQEQIKAMFNESVENHEDYVIGVAQIEENKKNVIGQLIARIFGMKLIESIDHIVGCNLKDKSLIIFELDNGKIIDKEVLTGSDFQLKKDSRLFNKIWNTFMNSQKGDRFDRDTFRLKTDTEKSTLLISPHFDDTMTDYPFENGPLIEALTALIKSRK